MPAHLRPGEKVTELTLGIHIVNIERKLDHFKVGVGRTVGLVVEMGVCGAGAVRVGACVWLLEVRAAGKEVTELTLGIRGVGANLGREKKKGTLAGAFEFKI